MEIFPITYEIVFRKRVPDMDYVEVVNKIPVLDWDGTKEQYYQKLRQKSLAGAEGNQEKAE